MTDIPNNAPVTRADLDRLAERLADTRQRLDTLYEAHHGSADEIWAALAEHQRRIEALERRAAP